MIGEVQLADGLLHTALRDQVPERGMDRRQHLGNLNHGMSLETVIFSVAILQHDSRMMIAL